MNDDSPTSWLIPPREGMVNDHLLRRFVESREPVVDVYPQETVMAVLGAGGRVERDLHEEACLRDGVAIARRRGGGGTVILSPGMLVLVAATQTPSRFDTERALIRIQTALIEALAVEGCRGISMAGLGDLAIGGRKILGCSVYRHKEILFYQSSLLIDNDLSLFARYLRPPWREPPYRAGRPHEDFCTTLRAEFPETDPVRLCERLGTRLSQMAQSLIR
jgi:lipoate---protein ligase